MSVAARIAILVVYGILLLVLFVAVFYFFAKAVMPWVEKAIRGKNDPQSQLMMPMAFCAYLLAVGWLFTNFEPVVRHWIFAWISN
jgi:hypothetical protein